MTALPIRQVTARLVERITEATIGVPIKLTLKMDEDWSPRVQGELTAPRKLLDELERPAGSIALGKLQADYLVLEIETQYSRSRPVSDYTAAMLQSRAALMALIGSRPAPWHPGEPLQPLSAATTLWGGSVAAVTSSIGGSIAKLTAILRQPGGSYNTPPTERRLVQVLDNPTVSPFGNPIPGLSLLGLDDSPAYQDTATLVRLTELPAGASVAVVVRRLTEHVQGDAALIGRLKDAGVVPNARVLVETNAHGDVTIVVTGHENVELPHEMAHAVKVERVVEKV